MAKIIKLEIGEFLLSGEVVKVLETHTDTDCMGNIAGYEILKVTGNIVVEKNGKKYVPAKIDDNFVIHWTKI